MEYSKTGYNQLWNTDHIGSPRYNWQYTFLIINDFYYIMASSFLLHRFQWTRTMNAIMNLYDGHLYYVSYLTLFSNSKKDIRTIYVKFGLYVVAPPKTKGSKSKHWVLPSTTSNFCPRQNSSPEWYSSPETLNID